MLPEPSIAWMLVLLSGVVASAIACRAGWRARRIAIPPTCRRCGYDVSHRPAGIETCSECGADLKRRGTVINVRRQPKWWIVLTSGGTLAYAAVVLYLLASDFGWSRFYYDNAPTWWIAHVARHNPGPSGDNHRNVWLRRDPGSAELYDHLLDLQPNLKPTDPAQAWLQDAYRAGWLNTSQSDRFARQFFAEPLKINLRTPVRQGDPLVLQAVHKPGGLKGGGLWVRYHFAARADGAAVIDNDRYAINPEIWTPAQCVLEWKDWAGELPPGRHTVNVVVGQQLGHMSPGNGLGRRIDQSYDIAVDVLPRDTPLGEAIDAPDSAQRIAEALIMQIRRQADGRIVAEFWSWPANVDRAFSIYAVVDGQRLPIGELCAQAGAEAVHKSLDVPISHERWKTLQNLTLIFVGDGEALRTTLNQTKYWKGQIVYPDVPVESWERDDPDRLRPGPTTRPYRVQ